jgi:hypothetical protein
MREHVAIKVLTIVILTGGIAVKVGATAAVPWLVCR